MASAILAQQAPQSRRSLATQAIPEPPQEGCLQGEISTQNIVQHMSVDVSQTAVDAVVSYR